MAERIEAVLPEMDGWRDPSLLVATADGRMIPSAEYYDEALSGWESDDPYVELTDLEDAMSHRGYSPGRRPPSTYEPAREMDLFIRRPVMPSADLVDVLQTVAPLHNSRTRTRCHKPGLDRDNGLHTTILNTRGLRGIELPDEETFDPTRRVPALGVGLGKLALDGLELFEGDVKYHVVLLFGPRAVAKLREERTRLEQEHFPGLQLQPGAEKRVFRPHVTLVSTGELTVAKQALDVIRNRATLPRKIHLAPARHSFYPTQYADQPA